MEIIAKDNLNIANTSILQILKILCENNQLNSQNLHTNSHWVHVIKVCLMAPATLCFVKLKFARVVKIIMLNYIILLL